MIVDQYQYVILLITNPINADYSALAEIIETNSKASKLKVNDRVRITKYKNIFSRHYNGNRSKEIFIIDSALKTNQWTQKFKDLNKEKNKNFLSKRTVAE